MRTGLSSAWRGHKELQMLFNKWPTHPVVSVAPGLWIYMSNCWTSKLLVLVSQMLVNWVLCHHFLLMVFRVKMQVSLLLGERKSTSDRRYNPELSWINQKRDEESWVGSRVVHIQHTALHGVSEATAGWWHEWEIPENQNGMVWMMTLSCIRLGSSWIIIWLLILFRDS